MEQLVAEISTDIRAAMYVRRVLSVLLGGMFLFELLNYFHLLSYQVNYTWLGRFVSTLAVLIALRLIDEGFRRKLGTRLQASIWILMTLLLWLDFLGDVFGFYRQWVWYDQLLHFSSGILLVICLWIAIRTCAKRRAWNVPPVVLAFFALGVNTIFAVLYEIEEYTEDVFFGTNRLGDAFDTANDLLLNLVGGGLVLLTLFFWKKYDHKN